MQTSIDTFVAAAAVAGHAPSIHNSQPWRWVAHVDALAHLTVTGDIPGTADAKGARQAIETRHTDRRPSTGTRIDADQLGSVTAAAACEGTALYVLPPDGITELAAATANAQQTQVMEPEWQAELAYWAGGTRPGGAGVPDSAIPQRPTETTVPGRDFGHPGSLPVSAADDEGATFAIVYGPQDEAVDWLRAGEGVSAAWLAAVRHGVSVLPMSATIEVDSTRLALRELLAGRGEPYLVLRLGRAEPDDTGPPQSPRINATQRIERALA